MKKIVISVLGQDRPGIIAAITRVLYQADCNIENVSQTILQSEFSGIFIGREVAEGLNICFGVADLSLAPMPHVGDSVGEIFQSLGLRSIGVPGTTAALALLNDAVKKGGHLPVHISGD